MKHLCYPLSWSQKALWFFQQKNPKSTTYNTFHTARLSGKWDIQAWQKTWQKLVKRHSILRTTYTIQDAQPVQLIHQDCRIPTIVTDASGWDDEELKAQILMAVERPFNLETGPLIRLELFSRSLQEFIQLLTIHHIACDGFSFDLLLGELPLLYRAEIEDLEKDQLPLLLPNKQKQYTDYVSWQSEMLTSAPGEKLFHYWQKQLATPLPVLNLPTDRLRPPVLSDQSKFYLAELNPTLIDQLRQLASSQGVSLYRTFLSAFFVLLNRYTGQKDILIGSPMASRWTLPEFKGIVGYFSNSVVLRANLADNPTFLEFLARIQHMVTEAQAHQDYPFALLVERLNPPRDSSRSPLTQVGFNWRRHRWYESEKTPNSLAEKGLLMEPYWGAHTQGTELDLSLGIEESENSLHLLWNYNNDLFEADTIVRLAEHFKVLLAGIIQAPSQKICELPLLTPAERHQLLVDWNDTESEFPKEKCIHQLFEEQVERTPSAIAVVFEDKQLTYRELNGRANQLAHYLRSLGVKPEVLVGICLERSIEMVVGLLGILKAGGAYVPLDPAYPLERLAFIMEETQIKVLLTQKSLIEKLPPLTAQLVCLDTDSEVIKIESKTNLTNSVTPDNLAYVMYTSGSTGRPKGVSVIHRGVVRLVKETNYVNLTAEEVFLMFAPISFDASTIEIWGSLLNGARLIIFSGQTPSPEELGVAIKKHQVTTLWLTAALFHLMVDERIEDLKPLRQLLAGGDVLSVPHVEKVLRELDCQLINGYGPTENTTFTCCYSVTKDKQLETTVPIGSPIANTRIYVLDSHLQPVPIGVKGELYIGGDGLARGYFQRPELSQEKFIPNPFTQVEGDRLYKTGDLVRYLPDRNIEFIGRIDNQVKVRGFRIELREIEFVLNTHPQIQQAIVIAREDLPGDKRLIAYAIASDKSLTSSQLRQFLKQKLPEYMVPSALVLLETLPITPNGKVDRQRLPEPDFETNREQEFIEPRNQAETKLAQIWQKKLNIEKIGIDDNFFDLGGHSLLLIQINSELQTIFNKEISMVKLFQYPTIHLLAQYLSQTSDEQAISNRAISRSKNKASISKQRQSRQAHRNQN